MADTIALVELARRTAMPPLVTWTDTATYTNSNVTSALQLSAIWTIPAFDLIAGTAYEIEIPFAATMQGQALTLGLSIDAATTFTVNTVINGTIVSAGAGISGTFRVKLQCLVPGSSGTLNCFASGSVNQSSTPVTFANSGSLDGNAALGVGLDTTAAHTIRVNSKWAASAAGQVATSYGSELSRAGR